MNNLIYIVCNFHYIDISRELVLRDNFLYSLEGSKIQSFALPYLLILIVFFLTSQTSSKDVSSENEWLDFLSLGVKVVE